MPDDISYTDMKGIWRLEYATYTTCIPSAVHRSSELLRTIIQIFGYNLCILYL